MTLLDRLGGATPVADLAHALYDRLLADDEIGPLFADTHMPTQRQVLATYLVAAFSDGDTVPAERLRAAHREHGVDDRHFSIMAGHVADILDDLGVDSETAADVLDAIAALRSDIVSESVVAGTWDVVDPEV